MKKLFFSLIVLSSSIFAQMNTMVAPPFALGVTSTPASIGALYSGAPTGGVKVVSNGAYDVNGSLLFYVDDGEVFDPSGTLVGSLGIHSGKYEWGAEVGIVPVPGECKKFYVIYSLNDNLSPILGYVIVDCSGTSPSIIYKPTTTNEVISIAAQTSPASQNYAFAISKIVGSGASATFYLYFTNGKSYEYAVISASGISWIGGIGYSSGTDSPLGELELSENGQWLANSTSVEVIVLQLSNPTTYATGSAQFYTYTGWDKINGLEFVGSGIPDLYVAGNGIFDKIDLQTQSQTAVSITPYNLDQTFLEYSKGGQICGFSEYNGSVYLLEYDPSTNTYITNAINFSGASTSNVTSQCAGIYTLPDQIDGGNYNNFSGVPNITIDQVTIDGVPVSTVCGVWQDVYNCNAIPLNVTFFNASDDDQPCSYQLEYTPLTEDCDVRTYHSPFAYVSEWQEGTMPFDLDIREYYYEYDHSFYNQSGLYRVTVRITDCCGNVSEKHAYINLLQSINPVIDLEIYDNNPPNPSNPWISASNNPVSPTNVGSASISYQVAGSTGNITGYDVLIEEVNSSGTPVGAGTIYNKAITTNNISGISTQNLNALCVPNSVWPSNPGFGGCSSTNPTYSGYTGYFSFTNGLYSYQKEYKITVTLLNPCSNSSAVAYVYVSSQGNRGVVTSINNMPNASQQINVYPNPASNEVTISLNAIDDEDYTVSILDISGRELKKISSFKLKQNQETNLKIDTSDLGDGIYICQVRSMNVSKTDLINITH